MKIDRVFGARLLIRPVEEFRDSNIILPVGVDVSSYRVGKVMKIGTLLRSSDALDLSFLDSPGDKQLDPIEGLEEGDLVIFGVKNKPMEVNSGDEKLMIIEFRDLIAKIEG